MAGRWIKLRAWKSILKVPWPSSRLLAQMWCIPHVAFIVEKLICFSDWVGDKVKTSKLQVWLVLLGTSCRIPRNHCVEVNSNWAFKVTNSTDTWNPSPWETVEGRSSSSRPAWAKSKTYLKKPNFGGLLLLQRTLFQFLAPIRGSL